MIGKNFREATKDTKSKGIRWCGRDAGGGREGRYKNGEKTASRTGTCLECEFFETTLTTRDNLFKVRRPNGRRGRD